MAISVKQSAVLGWFLCLVLVSGCSSDTGSTQSVEKRGTIFSEKADVVPVEPRGFVAKPGPDLRFEHNYTGVAQVNEAAVFQLSVTTRTHEGHLSVSLSVDEGLVLFSETSFEYDLAEVGERVKIPVHFLAREPGRYYLSVLAKLDTGDISQGSKAYGVALQVSDVGGAAGENLQQKSQLTNGETVPDVIRLPADEQIIE